MSLKLSVGLFGGGIVGGLEHCFWVAVENAFSAAGLERSGS